MNEEFEKWAQGEGYDIQKREDGAYRYVETKWALDGWQASRKQAVEECAQIAENQFECWDEGVSAGNQIAESIRALQKD